jgi:hypothetical protein
MKTYYQVDVFFALSHGKPSLVNMSFKSTSEYNPDPVWSTGSPLFLSRFFHSVPEAENYINYLYTRYPDSTAPRPVLDSRQLKLFQGA